MGNAHSNTGRGDEPTHVIRDIGDGDTKREHRPVSSELTEGEAEASNRKSTIKPAPESSYSYGLRCLMLFVVVCDGIYHCLLITLSDVCFLLFSCLTSG